MFLGKIDYRELTNELNGLSLEFHECAEFKFNWSGKNQHSFNRLFAVIESDEVSEVTHTESNKVYKLRSGGLYFLSNSEDYKFKFTENCYFLSFHFNCYAAGCREIFSDSKIFVESLNNHEWIKKISDLLHAKSSIKHNYNLYHTFFGKIMEFIPEIEDEKNLLYQRDMKIHQYLLNNANGKTTIDDLAALVNISADSLSRRFSHDYNKTLKKTLNQAIASRAEKLLRNDSLQIREIADILSFNDEYYFSKFFKRETGKSPSEFRKMIGMNTQKL